MASAAEILARREARQAEQVALVRGAGTPVVSLTIVSPGPDKDDRVARAAFAAGADALTRLLALRGWPERGRTAASGSTGPELLVAVDADPVALKRALVGLEDGARLGRLWDLDVVAGLREDRPMILSRRALDLNDRPCFVCGGVAAECARSARHPLLVVLLAREAAAGGVDTTAARAAADLAVRALVVEAELAPKPGLVDPVTNGAHPDMDLPLLLRSAEALRDWLTAAWLLGSLAPETPALTDRLVDLGLSAEAAMRSATGGVNTHKGALFGLGLLLAAWGAKAVEPVEGTPASERVCARVAELATPLLTDWVAGVEHDPSHGSAAYRELGLTGVRGEAASGFATARTVGLPAYRARLAEAGLAAGEREADALRWALVNLMAATGDTCLVARGGQDALATVQNWASRIVKKKRDPLKLAAELAQADAPFTERNWSPGGSADLLAVTWLLHQIDTGAGLAEA